MTSQKSILSHFQYTSQTLLLLFIYTNRHLDRSIALSKLELISKLSHFSTIILTGSYFECSTLYRYLCEFFLNWTYVQWVGGYDFDDVSCQSVVWQFLVIGLMVDWLNFGRMLYRKKVHDPESDFRVPFVLKWGACFNYMWKSARSITKRLLRVYCRFIAGNPAVECLFGLWENAKCPDCSKPQYNPFSFFEKSGSINWQEQLLRKRLTSVNKTI